MAAKERTAMQPILQDIRKAIQQVRQEKGLDVILEAGAVIDGGTDVTSEVGAKLTNNLKMKKRPFGVSFCVEVVWCKRGSSGLFCFAGLFLYPKWQGRLYNKRNKVFGGRHGIA